ncbi:NUDIX hydrolase [Streptococcus rifensis]
MANPTFGQKIDGADYQNRYGVYAIIPNPENTEIILVQAPNGAWFLPGGEIEAGENHEQALSRELIEELGYAAKIGDFLGQADEYFYSRHRDTHYYHPAYLYAVTSFSKVQQPLEDFNHLAWFPIDEAITQLKRGSHQWGVQEWQKRQ